MNANDTFRSTGGLADLWQEASADEDFRFEIKAQDIAVDLARAVADSGMSRTQLADRLGWKASRVSRILSGSSNLTLRTIHQLTEAIGFEFDMVLRRPTQERSAQPWEKAEQLASLQRLHDHAHEHIRQSKQLLETATELNRRSWKQAQEISALFRVSRDKAIA